MSSLSIPATSQKNPLPIFVHFEASLAANSPSCLLLSPPWPWRSPELHEAAHERQRDEILAVVLGVVEEQPAGLQGPEFHGNPHRVVGLHHLEGQVGLAPEAGDEVPDGCGAGEGTQGRSSERLAQSRECFPAWKGQEGAGGPSEATFLGNDPCQHL